MEKAKSITGNCVLVFLVLLVIALFTGCGGKSPSVGYNQGYAPEQPIPFDHSLHAGTYKVNCQYCHVAVENSKHASVPSLNICMNCHMGVATDKPNIKKIQAAYAKGESIAWVKVHMLPDHVHFNHKRHVRRGVACQTCHGPVETMSRVSQHADLSMGWCINCHRKPEYNAPQNCSTCHY